MSEGFAGQPYLDQLRPDPGWSVRVALLTSYSADPIAIGAALLSMTGRNSEEGNGNAADFAESVERLRGCVRIIVQRGRLQRPSRLPQIAGVLDQFIVEQSYDEDRESWHPKLALVGYEGPSGERSWRLWIGSRNLTRSRDLDLGLMIDGESRRRKGARLLPDVAELGSQLAALARLPEFSPELVADELAGIAWRAPDDIRVNILELRQSAAAPMTPCPEGKLERFIVLSPFLCNTFVAAMADWGDATTERTLVTTLPAIRALSLTAKRALAPFQVLALAPPQTELDIAKVASEASAADAADPLGTVAADDGEAEPPPVSLHAKLFAFWRRGRLLVVAGSPNATDRAWSGRNAEAAVTFEAGPVIANGINALVGRAMPIPRELLDEPVAVLNEDPTELLDSCRRHLVAHWSLTIARNGDRFLLHANAPPPLTSDIRLDAGLATADLLDWPDQERTLDLGQIPLGLQTDLVQLRLVLGSESCGWLQRVDVNPPIAPERDRAAIARFLGPRGFYAWMRGMLDGNPEPLDGDSWDQHSRSAIGPERPQFGRDALTLEDILTAWARDSAAFRRTDVRFEAYLNAVLAHDDTLDDADRKALQALQAIWTAARDVLMARA